MLTENYIDWSTATQQLKTITPSHLLKHLRFYPPNRHRRTWTVYGQPAWLIQFYKLVISKSPQMSLPLPAKDTRWLQKAASDMSWGYSNPRYGNFFFRYQP